jgi:HAMP domain-containing protein
LIVDVKNHIQDKRLAENIKEFNRHLNHREYILKLLSKELLQNPRYKDILLSGFENKNILIKNLDLFKSFMKENQINILEIGDQKGRVVFRFHRPEDFGDSKIDQKIIQEAIAGKVSTSLETGKSGLGYRTTTPIENYGTLLVGETVDRDFIKSIVDFNNVKMALFSKNKLLASSDEAIDNYIKENLERKNNDRIKYNNSSYYTTSIDYDSHGSSNLDLQFFLMVNEDRIELFVNNIWYLFGGISILIFLFVFILGYIFSNDIIQAIKTLNSAMKNIDDSESQKHLDIQRKDEIGEITKIFILMKDQIFQNQKNLESMIENRTKRLELEMAEANKQIAKNLPEFIKDKKQFQIRTIKFIKLVKTFSDSDIGKFNAKIKLKKIRYDEIMKQTNTKLKSTDKKDKKKYTKHKADYDLIAKFGDDVIQNQQKLVHEINELLENAEFYTTQNSKSLFE